MWKRNRKERIWWQGMDLVEGKDFRCQHFVSPANGLLIQWNVLGHLGMRTEKEILIKKLKYFLLFTHGNANALASKCYTFSLRPSTFQLLCYQISQKVIKLRTHTSTLPESFSKFLRIFCRKSCTWHESLRWTKELATNWR